MMREVVGVRAHKQEQLYMPAYSVKEAERTVNPLQYARWERYPGLAHLTLSSIGLGYQLFKLRSGVQFSVGSHYVSIICGKAYVLEMRHGGCIQMDKGVSL